MSNAQLEAAIEAAWEARDTITPATTGEQREAIVEGVGDHGDVEHAEQRGERRRNEPDDSATVASTRAGVFSRDGTGRCCEPRGKSRPGEGNALERAGDRASARRSRSGVLDRRTQRL